MKKVEITNGILELAVSQAKYSDHKQRMGCIIFNKKRILSKGYNHSQKSAKKLHPKFQRYPGSIHAEVDAILKARKDLKGSSLVIIRINKSGEFRLSKPCSKCLMYIESVGIVQIR